MQQHVPWLAANRYEVGEIVGQGGYGMVCRGFDRKTGRNVALKMLSPEAGRDPDVVERMLREQQALVALSGTCAVTAIDLCRLESGAPCLVMEWLDGCDLEQQLTDWEAAGQRGTFSELLTFLQPLTETLERAHQIGIVHRDIKPANIFLTSAPVRSVRLLDFGLSRMKSAAPLTAVGMVMGSPSYIAPETWRGNSSALDGRADLFALAVVVFRWLTGTLPFDAPNLIGKMTAVTSGPRPSAVALRPELPSTVDAWLARALAIDPGDRFQSGTEMYAAFEAALRGVAWQSSADVSGMRAQVEAPTTSTGEKTNALATAWRAAASLLKRFTTPRDSAPDPAPGATPPVPVPVPDAPTPTPVPAAPHGEPPKRNTVWLDSSELEAVPVKRNTVWLDSSELEAVPVKRNTLWLDSSELQDVVKSSAPPEAAEPAKSSAKKRVSAAKPKKKVDKKAKKAGAKKPSRKKTRKA
ncbi:MAG TPA: serine/threonine-protein kinase [Polyangiaceae bacterium]|nr:serine/threonine-protein kinase [Polyangiaceae bacterium]